MHLGPVPPLFGPHLFPSLAPEPSMPTSGLVVHHMHDSRSMRILWLLEELGISYTIKHSWRDENGRAPKETKDVHPLGKLPIITDGGTTLAESGAIVDYLLHKYDKDGKHKPSEEAWATNSYYTHFCEGSFMADSMFSFAMESAPSRVPIFIRPIASMFTSSLAAYISEPPLKTSLEMIENHLASLPKGANFAGGTNYTSADFMMILALEFSLKHRPKAVGPVAKAWVEKVQKSPSYQKALEKGGPYIFTIV